MQAFEIAQRGNFVVVMFRVKPTIKVARFHRKGVVCNPVGDNGGLCARAQIQSRKFYKSRGPRLIHLGMVFVGTPYGQNPQILVTDGIGGSPYGPGTLAGTDGSRQPVDAELTTARNLGSRRNSSMISRARACACARDNGASGVSKTC